MTRGKKKVYFDFFPKQGARGELIKICGAMYFPGKNIICYEIYTPVFEQSWGSYSLVTLKLTRPKSTAVSCVMMYLGKPQK